MTCNWLGGTHCNRDITSLDDLGKSGSCHINKGSQLHEWRSLAQCRECYEKDCAVIKQAIGQMDWQRRRLAKDYSLGEAARSLNLGTAVYSQLEHMRMVAPDAIVADFDRLFPAADVEDCSAKSAETPNKQADSISQRRTSSGCSATARRRSY